MSVFTIKTFFGKILTPTARTGINRIFFSFLSASLLLTGCSIFKLHQEKIQQGNLLTQSNLQKIHQGMSREEVVSLLGSPVLVNTFQNNVLNYVYTYSLGGKRLEEKHLTLVFRGQRLVQIAHGE